MFVGYVLSGLGGEASFRSFYGWWWWFLCFIVLFGGCGAVHAMT